MYVFIKFFRRIDVIISLDYFTFAFYFNLTFQILHCRITHRDGETAKEKKSF